MKGWVYIISNKAILGVIKVGFSSKDPKERAAELGTGAPYPYTVEYEALVDNPKQVEKLAHEMLAFVNAGKEWFECDVSVALKAIKKVCENRTVYFEHHPNNSLPAPDTKASKPTQLTITEVNTPSFNTSAQLPALETPTLHLKLTTQVVRSAPKQLSITEINTLKSKPTNQPVVPSIKKSIQELILLAKEGNTEAQYELATRYDQGDGVRKDLKEAYRLWVSASSKGHILASLAAGKAHLKGRGAEKSEEKAVPFIVKAAEENHAEALYHLSELAYSKYIPRADMKEMSPEVFAFEMMKSSAEQGFIPAYRKISTEYLLQDNYKQAFEWSKKAAENGDIAAQNELAGYYLEGFCCKRNLDIAFQWYSSAAKAGHKTAKKRIAEWDKYVDMFGNL